VARASRFCIIGAHAAPEAPDDGTERYFDGVDVLATVDAGSPVVVGLRTSGYMRRWSTGPSDPWIDNYRPLAVTLNPVTVRHWDFSALLWVGPEPRPCLLWCNADYVSAVGVKTLLFPAESVHRVLDGPSGAALPRASELSLTPPLNPQWHDV
jgi:hypothetical protein